MADGLNTCINRVDTDFWRDLCVREGELRHYKRGAYFVRAGEVSKFIGYTESCALKYTAYSNDGMGHVVGLEYNSGIVADLPHSLYGEPSKVSIVAMSPCDIYCLPTRELAQLMLTDARVKETVMRTTEALYSSVYDRYLLMHCMTPQERFDELARNHPDIFRVFPLKDIASYLNITPTHLSRLRRNVKNDYKSKLKTKIST